MPKRIFKYELLLTNEQHLLIPADAPILSVGQQGNELRMWALVDPAEELVKRSFYIAGTGHPIPDNVAARGVFLGTVQTHDGLVWHIFEVIV